MAVCTSVYNYMFLLTAAHVSAPSPLGLQSRTLGVKENLPALLSLVPGA